MKSGCSSHSCYIQKPIGQGTNSGCHCLIDLSKENQIAVKKKFHKLKKLEALSAEFIADTEGWYSDEDITEYNIKFKEVLQL